MNAEETARLALRSDLPRVTEIHTAAVKKEEETPVSIADEGSYQPPNALLESVALLEASRIKIRDQHARGVKPEPDSTGGIVESEYQPSSAWIETMQLHQLNQRHRDVAVAVKVEPDRDRYTSHRRQEYGSVKTEPALLDSIPGGPPQGLYHGRPPSAKSAPAPASVKHEHTHSADRVPIPAVPQATLDPRRRPVNNPPKRLKEEDEEGGINNVGLVKKMRVARN
ncbi:hypothetical protein PILCRDRAFT_816626 [Piloderma croceum F 1598]|uniref:Uncharacterized protein n=1 Tax=Piloderma croceum (strain F 1598) TaxID=765440 RepID=A0A0C3C8P7_PILCF|nr:hypothetical protein PILCRDRAFT_816626 [Piloderma croceum F 1598]